MSDVEICRPHGHLPDYSAAGDQSVIRYDDCSLGIWARCTCGDPGCLWSLTVAGDRGGSWSWHGDQALWVEWSRQARGVTL